MRYHEFGLNLNNLVEGVGLARRKQGELFKNSNDEVLIFQELDFFPPVGKFPTTQDLEAAKNNEVNGKNVIWVNNPSKQTLAFAIAKFKKDNIDGPDYYLGKYFREIKANRNDNDFAHADIPGNFRYSSKAGAKENAGYKPSEVLTQFDKLTPDLVAQQIITKFGDTSDEAQAVQIFMEASNFPVKIPKGQMNFDAFKIYFCELLQPIALIKGMTVGGNLSEAVDTFFGPGTNLGNFTIQFNNSRGGSLSDSKIQSPDGTKELKISTKDAVGGGANASAQNFFKCMTEAEKTEEGRKILENNKIVRSIIEAFKGNEIKDEKTGGVAFDGKTHYSAPLDIAKIAGILTDEEVQQVYNLKKLKLQLGDTPIGKGILSEKLEKFYSDYLEKWKKPVVPLHTIMLIIAYKVTKWVNEQTNFSSQASEILNRSALIQVYTNVVQSDKEFIIRGMNVVYPSKAVTGVKLTTEKAYWTTGGQGNMTFAILYNNESVPVASTPTPSAPVSTQNNEPVTAPTVKSVEPIKPEITTSTTSTSISTVVEPDELSQIKNLAGIKPQTNFQTTQTSTLTTSSLDF